MWIPFTVGRATYMHPSCEYRNADGCPAPGTRSTSQNSFHVSLQSTLPMAADMLDDDDDTLPVEAIKRADALAALRGGPMTRADLMAALGVSRTTIHRIVRGLEGRELLIQDGSEFGLSALGRTVADEVATYRRRLRAARRLQPFLETVGDASVGLDVGLFDDATVTVMEPTNPYAPVVRFMGLLRDSGTLRGFDTTTVAPVYAEEIRDEILGGMETDVVYLSSVVEEMVEAYPDAIATAIASGRLALAAHDDLPFGLAVFDDRVGLGGYDDETGMLRVLVDTADPAAREWALDRFRRYRQEAEPVVVPRGSEV